MSRNFQNDLADPDHFVVTMELVPKGESAGRSIDTAHRLANDALIDGRLSAVTITDNPGGNPSLSPDVLGREIQTNGMDVIIHFTCRDTNRAGVESRALQLKRMGMPNILALTGDYSGKGFGGQGAPVFDLDSSSLLCLFSMMNEKSRARGEEKFYYPGCAISPFKWTEPEAFAQYFKLCKKVSSGANYIVTQLGYDARKFQELIQIQKQFQINVPAIASIFLLTPRTARVMNSGRIPGAVVHARLLKKITQEWATSKRAGYHAAVERAAKLAVIVKGLGYRGIHIGGVHRSFKTVGLILDHMKEMEHNWQDYLCEFDYPQSENFYVFDKNLEKDSTEVAINHTTKTANLYQRAHFGLLNAMHEAFFRFDSPHAGFFNRLCKRIDQNRFGFHALKILEDGFKKVLLSCRQCGDCGIQHVGYLCPESKCPKHTRNGACGGSRLGKCEVHKDRYCVWYLAYMRLSATGRAAEMATGCVPPRMWELNKTSSWINFHLQRDHQSVSSNITRFCSINACRVKLD